jgi:hypothetical protein
LVSEKIPNLSLTIYNSKLPPRIVPLKSMFAANGEASAAFQATGPFHANLTVILRIESGRANCQAGFYSTTLA